MRTSNLPLHFLVQPLAVAVLGILSSSAFAQNSTDIPVVSIRSGSSALEYCPPNADCNPLAFVLTRTGPRLDSSLQVLVFFGGTASHGIDYEALPGPVTFAAGQDRIVLSSWPIDDTVHEGNETVQARLASWNISAGNQYRIDPSNATATVSIIDNDPALTPPVVSLELVDGSATETLGGQNFADWAEFRVTRSGTVSNALDVFLHTEGTARLAEDYQLDRASDGRTVRLPAGLASLNVRLYVIDDAFYEGEETALVRVVPTPAGVVGYEVDPARSSVAMVIRDNELPTAPLISIRATVPETREPLCDPNLCDAPTPAPGVFVVSRSGGNVTAELTVFLRYSGTASSGVDYSALPGSVVFSAGVNTVELNVEASHDTLAEGDETVVAELRPDSSLPMEDYRVDPTQASARVVIHDNDVPPDPIVSIEATDPIAEESSYPLRRIALRGRFTVSRTGPTDNPLSVFVLSSGTATPGVDYPPLPWLVSIPPGTNKVELEVVPIPDDLPEPLETVHAELSQCPPLTDPPLGIPCHLVSIDPAKSRATVFIRDDGITLASLEITQPKDGEEFSAGTPIRIAVTALDLEGAITHVEFYDVETKIGESTINFFREPDPGTPIHHEFEWRGAAPGPHVLTARAVDSAGNSVTSAPVRITVGGVELPLVSIEATVPETTEPSPEIRVRPGVFTFKRTGDGSRALRVWVNYAGTATRGVDYEETPLIVEFPVGAASVEVLIGPLDDNIAEGEETVIGMLTPSPLAVVPDYRIDPVNNQARVVIHDNDPPGVPVVSIRATQPNTAEPCPVCLVAPGVFTISRTGSTEHSLFVQLAARGTATPGSDYARLPESVEIPAGRESVEVLVLPQDDGLLEGDETVIAVLLPDPSLAPVERYRVDLNHAEATVIIRDDETAFVPVVSLTAPQSGTSECPPGFACDIAPGVFLLTRTGPGLGNSLTVSLRYRGTASPGQDYTALPAAVTFEPNQEAVRLLVLAADDCLIEGTEDVIAELLPDPWPIPRYRSDPAHHEARVTIDDGVNPALPVVSVRGSGTPPEYCPPNAICVSGGFQLTRTGPGLDQPLTVRLRYTGTATAGADYRELPGLVTFAAGRDSATLFVQPIDDNLVEGDETVLAHLVCPDGETGKYQSADNNALSRVVILDNDMLAVPVVSIRATRPETQEPVCPPDTCLAPTPAPGVFTVSRRGGDLAHSLIVFLRYGGSALPRADYEPLPESVEIPASRESVDLDVTAHFDNAMEGDETVVAALLPDPSLGPIERYRVDPAQSSARVVIHDRTPPGIPMVTVVATDPFAQEGTNSNAGRNTATFEVRRVGETNSNLTVLLGISGTAANGVDYMTIPSHVIIPIGSRSARILVIPIDDNVREKIETVIVEVLNPPVPAVIPPIPPTYLGAGRAAAIIVDNDVPRPPCVRLSDGLFNVCFAVPFNDCFRVESTRDFKEWRSICTVAVDDGVAHYVDPDAPDSPHIFYRLVPVACETDE